MRLVITNIPYHRLQDILNSETILSNMMQMHQMKPLTSSDSIPGTTSKVIK